MTDQIAPPARAHHACPACGHKWIGPESAACPVCAIADSAPDESITSPVGLAVVALAIVSIVSIVVALWKA